MYCSFCKKDINLTASKEDYFDHGVKYSLYECAICGVQFWLPLKNPGAEWYEKDDRYLGANIDPTLEPNWNHRKIMDFFDSRKGKLLDVGCGTGNFLAYAFLRGWKVSGIDFDRNAVATAKNIFNIKDVSVDNLQSFHSRYLLGGNLLFDLVTFFDVFEHIDNHEVFLKMIKDLLVDSGYIGMSVPYDNGYRWLQPNDLPPRHLTRWNEISLKRYLDSQGFTVIYIKKVSIPLFYLVMKLRFRYGGKLSFNLTKKIQKKLSDNDVVDVLTKKSYKLKFVHFLAKVKDIVIFGIPASLVWLYLIVRGKNYGGLFLIAQKKDYI